MSMEIGSNHHHHHQGGETGDLMKPASENPPGLLRGGAPATNRRRFQQAIPAPVMSFGQPSADTPMPHHQAQLRFHGRHGGSRPPFNSPGSNPSAADGVASRNQQRFTAISAAVSRSAVGVYAPSRSIRNPKSTLMTMFYNGAVNVFDVPVDKAQEIMVLAGRASVSSPPSAVQKSDSPVPANTSRFPVPGTRKIIIQKPGETIAPHVSVISSPVPVVSQSPTISKSTPGYQNCTPAPTTYSGIPSSAVPPLSNASSAQRMQQASTAVAAAIKPIAVHQSRKASLARFLEKRKDRVSSVTPYSLSKSPLASTGTLGSASTASKLSCVDIAPSGNNCHESMSMDMYNDDSLAMSRRVVIELE
ncbi:hypothetical protein ACQJBY_052984 [Aegilops geniculata]